MQPKISDYVVVKPNNFAGRGKAKPFLAIKAFGKQLRQATFDSEETADLFAEALGAATEVSQTAE